MAISKAVKKASVAEEKILREFGAEPWQDTEEWIFGSCHIRQCRQVGSWGVRVGQKWHWGSLPAVLRMACEGDIELRMLEFAKTIRRPPN
jgi:hypothetical protein